MTATKLGRICFPGLGHLPPSGVNNQKIFESTTLGNIESLPFFTVHLQPSYSLHMPKKPSKKKGTCSSSCYHFPTLMLLSDGLFFGGGYLRSLHELEEDQQGPSYVYYAKIYLIQIPQKTSLKGRVPGSLDAVCLANKDSRIRRSIRTFISNRVECQFILVELYPFTQVWLLHFTEMYVVVFVTIGIFPNQGWTWKKQTWNHHLQNHFISTRIFQ